MMALRSAIDLEKTVDDIKLLETNLNEKMKRCTMLHRLYMEKATLTEEKHVEEEEWLVDLEIEVLLMTAEITRYMHEATDTARSSSPESADHRAVKRFLNGDHQKSEQEREIS